VASILGFGAFLPERVVTNDELSARIGKPSSWIADMSGIDERRWAAPSETVADLGVRAAQDCLAASGVDAAALSLVIVASGSSELRFPGPASAVAERIGAAGIPAIDLPLASAGALFGMSLASHLTAVYPRILLVASEKMSSVIDLDSMDPSTGMLFGDGAGACLISADDGAWQIIDSVLHSDGSAASILQLPCAAPLRMEGMQVIMQASRKFPAVVQELLARAGTSAAEVDHFIPHQANQNLILRIAKSLRVGPEKFVSNIRLRGNTSSASMLIAAAEADLSGSSVCFAAFGAGLHWGALLARRTATSR
jgi:3-oxoacyl-[acyl-carrier-protein] synthase-3